MSCSATSTGLDSGMHSRLQLSPRMKTVGITGRVIAHRDASERFRKVLLSRQEVIVHRQHLACCCHTWYLMSHPVPSRRASAADALNLSELSPQTRYLDLSFCELSSLSCSMIFLLFSLDSSLVSSLCQSSILDKEGRDYVLGFDRLALWPRTALVMSSLPAPSSCMSWEMTDFAPSEAWLNFAFAEAMLIVVILVWFVCMRYVLKLLIGICELMKVFSDCLKQVGSLYK